MTANASQLIVSQTQANQAKNLQESRKVIDKYLTDIKRRNLINSTQTTKVTDNKTSNKSLTRLYGMSEEK